jgi:hypothetical protein
MPDRRRPGRHMGWPLRRPGALPRAARLAQGTLLRLPAAAAGGGRPIPKHPPRRMYRNAIEGDPAADAGRPEDTMRAGRGGRR